MSNGIETVPLAEVKRHDALALFREAMIDSGSAAQTLAAVKKLADAGMNGETFASIGVIADMACLPPRTVERHLYKLRSVRLLTKVGREGRRTQTYRLPRQYAERTSAKKYALLPRWAAKIRFEDLNRGLNWAEKVVFASVVSRDSLFENVLLDESVSDRALYPVRLLVQETGLSRQAIGDAKAQLVRLGLLNIEKDDHRRDSLGQCRATADTLLLNPNFPVLQTLLHRRQNVADYRRQKVAESNGSHTLHGRLNLADTQPRSGGCVCLNLAYTQPKSGGCSESKYLKQPPNQITKATSVPRVVDTDAASVVIVEEEQLQKFIEKAKRVFAVVDPELNAAIESAFANGCALQQLWARAKWFEIHRYEWPTKWLPTIFARGIAEAQPSMKEHDGWPRHL